MKAMLLAAGRGERMMPLTKEIPKPLLTINNKPLIAYHLEKLAKTDVEQVVINHAYLGHLIEKELGGGAWFGVDIVYSPEKVGGLETAGGIIHALGLLDSAEFVVINADVWTDYNFENILKHNLENALAHLVLVKTPDFKGSGDFYLDSNGVVNVSGDGLSVTFSGISKLATELFNGWEETAKNNNGRLKLLPVLLKAIEQKKVTGEFYQGEWQDIGTPERLKGVKSFVEHSDFV